MNHRTPLYARLVLLLAFGMCLGAIPPIVRAERPVEQWGTFEVALDGPSTANPFIDVDLTARFTQGDRTQAVPGFYDGDGVYRIRFMPDHTGEWRYETKSNRPELDGKTGSFEASKPSAGNRGPVRVRDTYHFAYADGTPHFSIGTTCYAWVHQGDAQEERTLDTLKHAPFNKLRMCVFPKHYAYNQNEPAEYPFAGTPPRGWDFTRFNPAFFRHLERRIGQLRDLGIEADLILFHPYDKGHWQGLRIFKVGCSKYFGNVVIIPTTAEPLGLETGVERLLLLQQANRQPPQQRQILTAMARTEAALILTKDHIQHPVQ